MSIMALYNGKLISAKKAKVMHLEDCRFTCCGFNRKGVRCNAVLMLIIPKEGNPYFKETGRIYPIRDEVHIEGCNQENTDDGYSKEYKYRDRLQAVDNLNALNRLLGGVVAGNGNANRVVNGNRVAANNNHANRDGALEERRRDVQPRTVLDHVYCLKENRYNGDADDFLSSRNYEDYRNCSLLLEGRKISEARRAADTTGELAEALAREGITIDFASKRTILLQDPYIGSNSVLMILTIDNNFTDDDVKKIRNRVFWIDYPDFQQKTDKNGEVKWHGPYFAVYADWRSYLIPFDNGLRQVAIGRMVSKGQAQVFKNEELSELKDCLAKW